MALLGIPSGSLIARLGARTTMLVSDAIRAPLIALVPVLHWSGHLTYPLLLAIVFALGAFTAPYIASQRSIIPELFGDDERTVAKASGLFSGATQLPVVIGPALAGVARRGDRRARRARRRRRHVPLRVRLRALFVGGGGRVPDDEAIARRARRRSATWRATGCSAR